jgi:exodeoxyribonuclease VII small subunit
MNQTEPQPELSFEQALARLEQIAKQLEDQQLGLENSLTIYAEGVQLLRQCQSLLTTAERKIELLTGVDASGNAITKPVEDAATFVAEQATSSQAGLTTRKRKSSLGKANPEPPPAIPAEASAADQLAPWEDSGLEHGGSLF